jgi:DNA-binding NtrC family response regulator
LVKKILIIDGEIITCKAIKSHYVQKGYEVEGCTSYQEFQNKVIPAEFELVLLDLNLKDIKGLELLKIMRKRHPDLKIIVISWYLDSDSILKAKQLGAYTCITKNSQLFQLLDQIIETL